MGLGIPKKVMTGLFRFMKKHPAGIDLVHSIASSKFINKSSLYRSLVAHNINGVAKRYPHGRSMISVETILDCNSRCEMCAHSTKKMSGQMSLELFNKIVEDCIEADIRHITLSGYGEPLLDKHLKERIDLLEKKDIGFGLFTNASVLTKNLSKYLLSKNNFEHINFSVNGLHKSTYEKIMKGLDRDQSYKNIECFLRLKKQRKNDVETSISCIRTHNNKHEEKEFIRYWKKNDGIDYLLMHDLWERIGDVDANKIGNITRMHRSDLWKGPCIELWGGLFIYHDGKVSPCCDNMDRRNFTIGNIKKESLKNLFNNNALNDLRKLHLSGNRRKHSVCGKCNHDRLNFW